MEYSDFKILLSRITSATSVTGKSYTRISVKCDQIYYRRESGSNESIDLRELYDVYKKCTFINTSILRTYISGRKFSPSLAILIESELFDQQGCRINDEKTISDTENNPVEAFPGSTNDESEEVEVAEKDEGRFFAALANLLDSKYVKSKSLNKPITSSDVILYKNHDEMKVANTVANIMNLLLEKLGSNWNLGSGHLERFIDGMIVNHPILGTRIVEFDEEQHFTPARLDSLQILKEIDEFPFIDLYTDLCKNNSYLNRYVLPKHRVKENFENDINDFQGFQTWLHSITPPDKKNGYIEAKPGFTFIGGRIAQRAYYDSLRDIAHLATANETKLTPIIRFPKVYVALILKKEFDQVSMGELQKVIAQYLLEYYNYKVN